MDNNPASTKPVVRSPKRQPRYLGRLLHSVLRAFVSLGTWLTTSTVRAKHFGSATPRYSPKWVRAVTGPLGRQMPLRWLGRRDQDGNYNLWVIHHMARESDGRYVVRHWQVSSKGEVRKAIYPELSASTLMEAREFVPDGAQCFDHDSNPRLKIVEIWY